ncbi:2-hydroxychromene-2-carboxylate isomerase [Salinarimonas rosea]|uniref:2-hydroxychromene-2-carboxylate isomerase n=1 Tax=Salinarimonas rosea TaxID=552063 RepID=UPI0004284C6E|nr:2-hydroxychromene-2-carboxylate isomerase [Salinarimonas rosea]
MARESSIDFWLTLGSTYTFLTVMRLPDLAGASGVRFRWRPFSLRAILAETRHVPFADKPAKTAYMWRDIERRAKVHGFQISLPAPYPVPNTVLANRLALVGLDEGWGEPFVREAYRRWFELGDAMGSEPNVSESLRAAGQDPERALARANSDEIERRLDDETDAARAAGVFGSPTFAVGRELFWGDDRLEDAILFAMRGAAPVR